MAIHTIAVDFEGDGPSYKKGMKILGGTINAVQFNDALVELQNIKDLLDDVAMSPDVMFTIASNDMELAERVTNVTGIQP